MPKRTGRGGRSGLLAAVLGSALCLAGCSGAVGTVPPSGMKAGVSTALELPDEQPSEFPGEPEEPQEPEELPPDTDLPNSFELIGKALEEGVIDEETAFAYRVLAVFGDPQLPEELRGDVPPSIGHGIGAELQWRFETLSASHQALLAPFLMPPSYRGSWYDLREGGGEEGEKGGARLLPPPCSEISRPWSFFAGGPFKVWYPSDKSGFDSAARIVLETLVNDAYPGLRTLMDQEHLPDNGMPCNGNDDRLDVYLIQPPKLPGDKTPIFSEWGQTIPYPGRCDATPVFINLAVPPNLSPEWSDRPMLRHMVVHEYMHAIQYAYPVKGSCKAVQGELTWWSEATATWAQDYIYGNDFNPEHRYGKQYLKKAQIPIHEIKAGKYRGYLFPFYLARQHEPEIIRRSWEALEEHARPLGAIDSSLPGHFEERWPEFAVFNLNEPPVAHYGAWDSFVARLKPTAELSVELGGQMRQRFELPEPEIPSLALRAYRVAVSDDVRLLELDNTWADAGEDRLRVQALVRLQGGELQGPKDWTGDRRKLFCRDRLDERIEELVLVVSSSEWEDLESVAEPPEPPSLTASDVPCWRLRGSTEARTHKLLRTKDVTVDSLEVIEVDVALERTELHAPRDGLLGVWFQPVAGSLRATYEVTYTDHETGASVHCDVGPVERPIAEGDGNLIIWFNWWEERFEYLGLGRAPFAGIPVQCMGETSEYFSEGVWLGTADGYRPLLSGDSLSDKFSTTGPSPDGGTTTLSWEWRLQAERE